MVSRRQSLHHHRQRGLILGGRSLLLRIIFHGKRISSLLQQQRSNISKKKQQKGMMLRPCSVKRSSCTKKEQTHVREVLTEKEEKEKVMPTEDELNIKEVLHELPGIPTIPSNNCTKSGIIREVLTEKEEKEKVMPMEDEMNIKEVLHELPGIPTIPSNNRTKSGIIFIFERASLVPALVGKTSQILNPDDHANFMRRHKKNPYNYRPEIIHQALLEVADSKLYKTGRVQAIYVKTDEGLLIKIEPHMLIPRTFGRFCAMMLELLQKFSVKAKGKREKLLRLIVNPVTQHLPANCYKIGLSYSSEKRVRLKDYVGALNDDVNLVFVVGAMAHGKINCDYTDDVVSVSEFPLSAACCVRRISCAVEKKWKIL